MRRPLNIILISVGALLAIALIAYGTLTKIQKDDRWSDLNSSIKDMASLKEKAQETWTRRDTEEGLEESLWLYKRIIKKNPDDWEALAKLSHGQCWLGTVFLKNSGERLKAFKEGEEYGLRAIELNPYSTGARYWASANLAGWAFDQKSETKTLWSLWEARIHQERILLLDPDYFYGAPHLFWGVYFTNVSRALGQDLSQAKKHFEKALEVESQFVLSYSLYVENYLLLTGEHDKARELLAKALTIPTDALPDAAPENRVAREHCLKLWKKHFGDEEPPSPPQKQPSGSPAPGA